jgi:imidazolonepropionase-like amidohydrolase
VETWVAGGRLVDGRRVALRIREGRIDGDAPAPPKDAAVVDAQGLVLVPAFLDAHVHLSVVGELAEVARAELRGGIAAVLDLGMPERLLGAASALDRLVRPSGSARRRGDPAASDRLVRPSGSAVPLRVRFAGPLLTAPGGYPTQSWGANGYGRELRTPEDARRAVAELAERGARFAKLAFDPRYPLLAVAIARSAAEEAHRRGLGVAAHALDAAAVRSALDAGADVLAHAPVAPLPPDLLAEAGRRRVWVVSTLRAFAASTDGLRRLREAGARVAYGTDLGNEGTAPGIDGGELELLAQAGIDPIDAATRAAAELLGEPDLGHLRPGAEASLLGVPEEALRDPRLLSKPKLVLIRGRRPE